MNIILHMVLVGYTYTALLLNDNSNSILWFEPLKIIAMNAQKGENPNWLVCIKYVPQCESFCGYKHILGITI